MAVFHETPTDDERDDEWAAVMICCSRAGGDARVEVATPEGRREESLARNGEEDEGGRKERREEREARHMRGRVSRRALL